MYVHFMQIEITTLRVSKEGTQWCKCVKLFPVSRLCVIRQVTASAAGNRFRLVSVAWLYNRLYHASHY